MKFFLMLCGDLGIRHRTAARMCLANYDAPTRSLRFTTKGNTHQTLPVTAAIARVLDALPAFSDRNEPIINLLRAGAKPGHRPGQNPRMLKQWTSLKKRLGIRAELRIHDLRRTLAEDVWEATHDLRTVQAQLGHRSPTTSARYLANRIQLQDLEPVLQSVLALRVKRAQQQERS